MHLSGAVLRPRAVPTKSCSEALAEQNSVAPFGDKLITIRPPQLSLLPRRRYAVDMPSHELTYCLARSCPRVTPLIALCFRRYPPEFILQGRRPAPIIALSRHLTAAHGSRDKNGGNFPDQIALRLTGKFWGRRWLER